MAEIFQRGRAWLFSRRDAWAKIAAVVGLALLLFAGNRNYVQGTRRARLETAYQAVLGEVQRKNDALVLAKAVLFLQQVKDTNDPRAPQVQEFYQESLLREVVRLVEAGKEEKAKALLKSSESVIPQPPADV
jgi:hypothetical protein